jgi:hypothetical protein
MPREWYYAQGDRQVGPVSAKELKQAAADGAVQPTTLVWTEGMKDWKEARSIKGLAGLWPAPTPATHPPIPVRRTMPVAKPATNKAQPPEPELASSDPVTAVSVAQQGWLIGLTLLCCFPAGLILVWMHPRMTQATKWVITAVVGVFVLAVVVANTSKQNEGATAGMSLDSALGRGKPSGWGCINTSGRVIVPFDYDEVGATAEGLTPVRKGILWGFVDGGGAEVIKPQFKYAWPFADGLARLKEDDKYSTIQTKWGYVNRDGRMVVAFQFDEATDFVNGFAWVKSGGDRYFIDKTGKKTTPTDGRVIPDKDGGRYGLRGSDGRWVVRPQYTAFAATGPDRWVVYGDDRRTGLIDSSGKVIVALQNSRSLFQRSTGAGSVLEPRPIPPSPGDDLIAVLDQRRQLMGWIDRDGRDVISPRFFPGPMYFTEGLAAAKLGFDVSVLKGADPEEAARQQEKSPGYGKAGFIDPRGEWVIPPQFRDARPFWDGLAAVNTGGPDAEKWGFIDRTGKVVITPQYEAVGDFSEGLVWVKSGGRVGYIDKQGQLIVPLVLADGKVFRGGAAAVKRP